MENIYVNLFQAIGGTRLDFFFLFLADEVMEEEVCEVRYCV